MTPKLLDFFYLVGLEVERADKKHCDWKDKTSTYCAEKVVDEASEVQVAAALGDVDGVHGILAESIQVAAVAYKMYRKHVETVCNGKG